MAAIDLYDKLVIFVSRHKNTAILTPEQLCGDSSEAMQKLVLAFRVDPKSSFYFNSHAPRKPLCRSINFTPIRN